MREKVENFALALVLMAFILSAATVITLNCNSLYLFDINYLDIPDQSGMTRAEILENYDGLIEYNSIFHQGPLELSGLTMSPEGRQHFAEVRDIFVAIQGILLISTIILAMGTLYKLRRKQPEFLRIGATLTIGVPLLLGGLIAMNWDTFFVGFHRIFFRNDYWIFDVTTDPVISILPDSFFLHCAIMILSIILVLSGCVLHLYFHQFRHVKSKLPLNP